MLLGAHPTVCSDLASTSGRGPVSWGHVQQRHNWPARSSRTIAKGVSDQFSLWRGETPIPKTFKPAVVPGVRTVATPVLSPQKVFDRLHNAVHDYGAENFGAFYSSVMGGIVTDSALMVIHMDDHLVHRGHGVSECVLIRDGRLYQLPQHVQRLAQSAERLGIQLPISEAGIMRVILDVAGASRKLNGVVRFWLSVGRGGFGLTSTECGEPSLYALATSETTDLDRTKGWTLTTTQVPNRPSSIKSNNSLHKVLAQEDAESRGFNLAVYLDKEGLVQGTSAHSLAVIDQSDVLVYPPPGSEPPSISLQRLLALIPEEVKRSPNDLVIAGTAQRPLHQDDLLGAKEVFVVSSTIRVVPIVSWDKHKIGDGTPAITALALDYLLANDQAPDEGFTQHIAVPYGYVTGMRDQLV